MLNRIFESKMYSRFLLFFFFVMVAAAAFNGFYTKWRLNDGHPALGLAAMVEGTASRPYVYRQFLPMTANAIQNALPVATVERVSQRWAEPKRVSSRSGLAMRYPASESLQTQYTLRYHLVYYLTFFALLLSLFIMRRLCLALGASHPASIAAPALLALIMPFVFSGGGFFYDFTETLFMMSAVLLAISLAKNQDVAAKLGLLLLLAAVGAWNKEAFFWFVPTLYPLLRQRLNNIRAATVIFSLLFVSGCVYLSMRLRYAGNGGSTVDYQLWDNLRFYFNPAKWLLTESTYGVLLPSGFSLVTVLIFVGVAIKGWQRLSIAMRQHAALALCINLPLFLLFCSPGEMRNLSMLFPTFLSLLAMSLTAWLGAPHQGVGEPND